MDLTRRWKEGRGMIDSYRVWKPVANYNPKHEEEADVEEFYEHCNEPSSFIKADNFFLA
jgi:hypothetical protein